MPTSTTTTCRTWSTYDDIRTAATDGSLRVEVTEDNIYVLTGLADDIADGPDAVDRDQLELAVEFIRDVGDYSEDETVDRLLSGDRPLGKLVEHVLDPDSAGRPGSRTPRRPRKWEELERFVESRLRPVGAPTGRHQVPSHGCAPSSLT